MTLDDLYHNNSASDTELKVYPRPPSPNGASTVRYFSNSSGSGDPIADTTAPSDFSVISIPTQSLDRSASSEYFITNPVLPIPPSPIFIPLDQQEARVVEPVEAEAEAQAQEAVGPPLGFFESAVFVTAWAFAAICILCLIVAGCTPWFQPIFFPAVYCNDQYLWLFLISPISLMVLVIGNYFSTFRPHLILKCWSVSVITMLVPSLIMFVCFSSSLVNDASGVLVWKLGAYLILASHLCGLMASLTYLKFCSLHETALRRPVVDIPPPPGPMSITIGEDVFDSKNSNLYSATSTGSASK